MDAKLAQQLSLAAVSKEVNDIAELIKKTATTTGIMFIKVADMTPAARKYFQDKGFTVTSTHPFTGFEISWYDQSKNN